jgi:hypothetical protein
MSTLRKMIAQFRLDDDTVANGASVRVMRSGCRVIASPGADYILTKNPQGIFAGSYCYAVRSGTKVASSEFRVNQDQTGVTWSSGDSAFKVSWSNDGTATYVPAEGDRIVLDEDQSANFAEFYDNDVGDGTPITAAQTLPATGKLEGYVKFRDVDLMVTVSATDTYIFDVTSEARDVVTPEDFGATGDGSTDDRQAIQNALSYIGNVAGGGALALGAKTYYIALDNLFTGVNIDASGVAIIGQGDQSVIQADPFSGLVNNQVIHVKDGANDILLQNFSIDASTSGGGTPTPDAADGAIQIGETAGTAGCLRVIITGVKIKSRYSSAIAMYGVQGFTIINCILANDGGAMGGHGIVIKDTTDPVASKRGIISACQLYDNKTVAGNAGIYIGTCDRQLISDCSIRGWTHGIELAADGASMDVQVDTCAIREQAEDGINLSSGNGMDRLVIDGNIIQGCGDSAAAITTVCTNLVFTNNICSDSTESGAVFALVTGGVIANNVFHDNNQGNSNSGTTTFIMALEVGLAVYGTCSGMVITGNLSHCSVANLQNYGFGVGATLTDSTILGNHAKSNDLGDWHYSGGAPSVAILNENAGEWDTEGTNLDLGGGTLKNATLQAASRSGAEMYISSAAAVADTGASGTYVKINGTTASGATAAVDFTITTTSGGRLAYTGATTKKFYVSCPFSMQGTGVRTYGFRIAKGGTSIAATQINRKTSSTDEGAAFIGTLVTLAQNEYIELFVDSTQANDTPTISKMIMSIVEV